ncbi:MAG: class I SAM-dependent methyltransferase [Bdellovibrionales bacterium]|nr:class I SAM-dependent methyltransferase [Bdellovibrionales bacterium]
MEAIAYQALAETEESGWYYQARLKAIHTLIERYVLKSLKSPLTILDVGCGTGGSTNTFARYGAVTGIEPSEVARNLLGERFPKLEVVNGNANALDEVLKERVFDLCLILGVLYHQNVADPAQSLRDLAQHQKQGSWLIWNEATFPALRRQHDRTVHGARRFYPHEMKTILAEAGYETVHFAPLLAWAVPIAWILAKLDSYFGSDENLTRESADHRLPHPAANFSLKWLTYLEWRASLLNLKAPFGVSYLFLARKIS